MTRRPSSSTTCRNSSPLTRTCPTLQRVSAARSKLRASAFCRQHSSLRPRLTVASALSMALSVAEQPPPPPLICHRRRLSPTRPLAVAVLPISQSRYADNVVTPRNAVTAYGSCRAERPVNITINNSKRLVRKHPNSIACVAAIIAYHFISGNEDFREAMP